jgi:ATP-dependent helicase/nuclease subunit A
MTRRKLYGAAGEALAASFERLARDCHRATDQALCKQWLDVHADLLAVAARLIELYEEAKRVARVVDFVDVEYRVVQQLCSDGRREQMLARLDARYRHLLLDEFQDTSPLQWLVLEAWFSAGAGGRHQRSPCSWWATPKQSIYRFRGAEPRLFEAARDWLVERLEAGVCGNDRTWRNPGAVVGLVNAVFAGRDDYQGFNLHSTANPHPGSVRLLPLFTPPAAADPGAADPPVMCRRRPPAWSGATCSARAAPQRSEGSSRAREARAVAAAIADWVAAGARLPVDGGERPAEYRDVAILFRNRTHQAVFERELANLGIPSLSEGGGGLLDTLEVGDMLALLRCLIDPAARPRARPGLALPPVRRHLGRPADAGAGGAGGR